MSNIQQTTITKGYVKLTVADGPDPTTSAVWIDISIAKETGETLPVAGVQLIALRAARDAIAAEMARIEGLQGRPA